MERNRLKISVKMNDENKIRIGIPRKNLNKPKSKNNIYTSGGHTYLLLREAGWELEGYEPGGEKEYPIVKKRKKGIPDVEFISLRPRLMPMYLMNRRLELAIYGQDMQEEFLSSIYRAFTERLKEKEWRGQVLKEFENARDWVIYNKNPPRFPIKHPKKSEHYKNLEFIANKLFEEARQGHSYYLPNELCDLGYGKVDLCFITRKWNSIRFDDPAVLCAYFLLKDKRLNCMTEYPNLAYRELSKYFPQEMISINENTFAENIVHWLVDMPFRSSYKRKSAFVFFPEMFGEIDEELKKLARLFTPPKSSLNKINILHLPTTESGVADKIGNIGLECISSGRTLKAHDLRTIGEPVIKNSTARLYCIGPYFKGLPPVSIRENLIYEIVERLKEASLRYGEKYPDSIYYKGEK